MKQKCSQEFHRRLTTSHNPDEYDKVAEKNASPRNTVKNAHTYTRVGRSGAQTEQCRRHGYSVVEEASERGGGVGGGL